MMMVSSKRSWRGLKSLLHRECLLAFTGCLFFFSLSVPAAINTAEQYDRDKALASSQAAINRVLSNHAFRNEDRKTLSLNDFLGKPMVISLIYTSCHHICPTITRNLAAVVEVAEAALGTDSFSVLTIGFDTANDSPERMRLYARERGINQANWHFLSADEQTIAALTKELGFLFFASPRGFDHLSQVSIVDAEGRVYRQLYGVSFDAMDLGEPLKQLVFGKRQDAGLVEGWINNIKLFCTNYDPRSGRYEFDYSIFVGFFLGFVILAAIALFVFREWRHGNARGA